MKIAWNETKLPKWESAESVVDGSLKAQERILSGYNGNENADLRKLREALAPRHVAISLTGEPTLYEHLGELIAAFHKRAFTTFLVTNGTNPSKLAELSEEPTQLYVSLCAPNREVYSRVCRPQLKDAWVKLNETLGLLPSFRCPTVIRTTLVKGLNMENTKEYARLIDKAKPTYVEAKAYMHVGFSSLRLSFDHMPSHEEVCEFASRLAEEIGYRILDESSDSRVVLLSRLEKAIRFDAA